MGGMSNFVEEKTKIATWIAFKKELGRLRGNSEDGSYLGGMQLIFSTNKKKAFQMMQHNDDESGWVLWYRLHS